ncbi:MAG: 30S ribosomal protein S16 [Candidatus Dojkabacteria bacterium]|nr:30S ribosomal protein S16 [Candidatus Dojkabacteria bacterium]
MVKIRLARVGRTHYATFKIVVTPAREKQVSKFIEEIGRYNPHTKELVLDKERAAYWISVGAQPTDTVKRMLIKDGIVEKPKKKVTFSKKAW